MKKQAQLNKYLEAGILAIFQVENQVNKGLKAMIEEASSSGLKKNLRAHQKEKENQITRLKEIATIVDIDLENSHSTEKEGVVDKGIEAAKSFFTHDKKTTSKIIEGLVSKGRETLSYLADSKQGGDLAIASGAQLIEEFEIMSYRVLCVLAKKSENEKVAKLLKETLQEEESACEEMKSYFAKSIEKIDV